LPNDSFNDRFFAGMLRCWMKENAETPKADAASIRNSTSSQLLEWMIFSSAHHARNEGIHRLLLQY